MARVTVRRVSLEAQRNFRLMPTTELLERRRFARKMLESARLAHHEAEERRRFIEESRQFLRSMTSRISSDERAQT
jgi:hypothetical protein